VHLLAVRDYTLDAYRGQYFRTNFKDYIVSINQEDWMYIVKLTEFCIRRELWELLYLQDYLIEWHDSCGECISFTTSKYPTSTIEFGTLYYEMKCKRFYWLFNKFRKYCVCCIVHVKIKNNVLFCCNVRVYFYLPTPGRIFLQKETSASIKSRKWGLWMLSSTTYLSAIPLDLLHKT
jgi:hypothetical protein